MALILDNVIKGCTPNGALPGPMNAATAYCYQPIPAGVDAKYLTIEINGKQQPRKADCDVFLYKPGDKSGEWELLADVTADWFERNFDHD